MPGRVSLLSSSRQPYASPNAPSVPRKSSHVPRRTSSVVYGQSPSAVLLSSSRRPSASPNAPSVPRKSSHVPRRTSSVVCGQSPSAVLVHVYLFRSLAVDRAGHGRLAATHDLDQQAIWKLCRGHLQASWQSAFAVQANPAPLPAPCSATYPSLLQILQSCSR